MKTYNFTCVHPCALSLRSKCLGLFMRLHLSKHLLLLLLLLLHCFICSISTRTSECAEMLGFIYENYRLETNVIVIAKWFDWLHFQQTIDLFISYVSKMKSETADNSDWNRADNFQLLLGDDFQLQGSLKLGGYGAMGSMCTSASAALVVVGNCHFAGSCPH